LHKEDFQVVEDGRPLMISFFEEHKGAAPTTILLPPNPAFSRRIFATKDH